MRLLCFYQQTYVCGRGSVWQLAHGQVITCSVTISASAFVNIFINHGFFFQFVPRVERFLCFFLHLFNILCVKNFQAVSSRGEGFHNFFRPFQNPRCPGYSNNFVVHICTFFDIVHNCSHFTGKRKQTAVQHGYFITFLKLG